MKWKPPSLLMDFKKYEIILKEQFPENDIIDLSKIPFLTQQHCYL